MLPVLELAGQKTTGKKNKKTAKFRLSRVSTKTVSRKGKQLTTCLRAFVTLTGESEKGVSGQRSTLQEMLNSSGSKEIKRRGLTVC